MNNKAESNVKTNGHKPQALATSTTIQRQWGGIPGALIFLPVTIALSGEMISERERLLGLPDGDRNAALELFRVNLLADVLEDEPYIIRAEKVQNMINEKAQARINEETDELKNREGKDKNLSAARIDAIYAESKLTEKEFSSLREPLPDFTPGNMEDLGERAKNYFSQTDRRGRLVFQRLLEDVIDSYWTWALPRPISSASEYLQTKPDTFTSV